MVKHYTPRGEITAPASAVERVERLWPESTIVCIGGGPSLTAEDVAFCRDRARVIAVNDAYRLAPWADVLYACDDQWWAWHAAAVEGFAGLKFSLAAIRGKWPGVRVLRIQKKHGLALDPTTLASGDNSGYQAVNLAVHLGARRVILLGYDMAKTKGGRSHWFGEHPKGKQSSYAAFQAAFATLPAPLAALGVTVTNCSRVTALKCFPRMPLAEALAKAELEAAS